MTDEQYDPQSTFAADQAEAQEEMVTRDRISWEVQVATADADLAMKGAHTQHTLARASAWEAFSWLLGALALAATLALVYGVIWGAIYLVSGAVR